MGQVILRKYFSKVINLLSDLKIIFREQSNKIVAIDYHYFFQGKSIEYEDLEVAYDVLEKQLNIISSKCDVINALDGLNQIFNSKTYIRNKLKVIITIDDADISIKKAIQIFCKFNFPIILFVPIGLCLEKNSIDAKRSLCFLYYSELINKLDFGEKMDNKKEFYNKIISSSSELLDIYLNQLLNLPRNKSITGSRKLLSIDELRALSLIPNITISSHSMSHSILSELPLEWLRWEIKSSQKYIKEINGDTSLFCYPFGYKYSFSKLVQSILIENGVKYSFTTVSTVINKKSIPLALGRIGMLNYSDRGYVMGTVKGAFQLWDILLKRI